MLVMVEVLPMALELESSGAAAHLFEEINFEVGNNRCATMALEHKSSGRRQPYV